MIEIPESRGSQNVPNYASTLNQSINHRNNKQYSEVTQQSQMFPRKEQAIILSTVEDLTVADYVTAVGNITGPNHIRFASRISNNRICIYLSNAELVEKFVSAHSVISVRDKQINVRKLITPARRIIISNVCPTIPHNTISSVLKSIGLKLVSPISFMRAGIPGDEYGHVLSFRRQVYTQPDEAIELPSSLVIKHEETSYRIFLTFDEMSCFICKQQGHLAKNCTSVAQQPARDDLRPEPDTDILVNVDHNTDQIETTSESSALIDAQSDCLPEQRPHKRAAPSLSSTVDTSTTGKCEEVLFKSPNPLQSSQTTVAYQTKTRKSKKLKKSESTESLVDLSETLKPAINLINEQKKESVLNYEQLVDFFENVHGSSDPLSVARQYTTDVQALIGMLLELHQHLEHRNTKSRCTRVRKKLERQLELENESVSSEDDNDESQTSY